MTRLPLSRKKAPRVLVKLDAGTAYGRELLAGIVRYSRVHGPWVLLYQPLDIREPDAFPWDATIGLFYDTQVPALAQARQRPIVTLSAATLDIPMGIVRPHGRNVGRLAAEHFTERGFRHFAFVGPADRAYSIERRDGYMAAVAAAGHSCACYPPVPKPGEAPKPLSYIGLGEWIRALPKPVGVMACEDIVGWTFIGHCLDADQKVPEEIAVVGVNNDEVYCNAADVPLSSVELDAERIGFEGAALLDRLMAGEPVPPEPILLEPVGVVTRQSSDLLAIDDPDIVAALRLIRLHACDGLGVPDLLRQVPVNRRWLERRFRQFLGRTPHQEITRQQIARASQLLADSDLSVAAISEKCGFSRQQHFGALFRKMTGTTPAAYRRAHGAAHRPANGRRSLSTSYSA